jgi:hypothetical protein
MLTLLTGCFSSPNKLTFRSNQTGQVYAQNFGRAFYSQTEDGRYDVVLMEDGIVPTQGKSSGPLTASSAGPLSQTVQIRVLWKPLRMTRPDAPSATNSVIDWYVRTSDPGADRLHYRGAGFVSVTETRNGAKFSIRNAQVELSNGSGRLHDPLGASSLSGSFEAVKNHEIVASTIELLHRENGNAQPRQDNGKARQASIIEGAPPRTPGP